MRVGANVQDNQLLLWVNEIELEEVNNLLVKLGEIPPEGGRRSTTRVIDASRQPETYEYLKRLKEQWDKVSPNPLIIPDAVEFAPAEDPEAESVESDNEEENVDEKGAVGEEKNEVSPPSENITLRTRPSPRERLVSLPTDNERTAKNEESQNSFAESDESVAPPVRILIDEAGNLIIQSDDTGALDRLEEIMQVDRPPRKPYDIFKVKYARASWVALNLEEYFDKKKEDDRPRFFSFFYDDREEQEEERQLGDRPPLRFIWDNDTNSIVVQGADDVDRKTIQELIELWDVPEPVDDEAIRYTRLVKIKFSRADNIVNTIKDAYRDLLSANDKAFQAGDDGEGSESKRSGSSQGVQDGGGMSFSFAGKLSLGADTITNSIIVSAEGQKLLDLVCDMIDQLDQAARQEGSIAVYQVPAGLNGKSLEASLRAIFQTQQQPQKKAEGGEQQPQQNAEAEARGRERRESPFGRRGSERAR